MPRFDRYLLIQLLAVFGFFALVLVSVYWINSAIGLFEQLIGDGQSALVFLEFSLLTLPNVIRTVLPIAAFAASIYVANRLMQDSELVVMQATGFSAFRLARPVLGFGLIVTLALLILANILVPASRGALIDRYADIRQSVTARFLTDGQFTHPADGLTLYIRELAATGELLDLFLTDARNPRRTVTYSAEKALFARTDTGPKLLMFNGMIQQLEGAPGDKDQNLSTTRFTDFTYDLGGLLPEAAPGTRGVDALSTAELLSADPALLAETGMNKARFLYEAHNRLGQPLLAIGAALIGFGALLMGSFSRFGLWRQIILAIVLLVFVQAVSSVTTTMSMKSEQGWPWTYAAAIVALVLGGSLLWWSQRPRRVNPPPAAGVAAP